MPGEHWTSDRRLLAGGMAALLLGVGRSAQAATFVTLISFGPVPDSSPGAGSGVVMDSAGNLYGETEGGGTGFGTIFKLTPAGVLTTLYTFGSAASSSQTGQFPYGGLSLDAAGDLYGTATYGGANRFGVAFKITQAGQEAVLHDFTLQEGNPSGGGVLDSQGNFTVATLGGTGFNAGELLAFSPSGAETLLYTFSGGADGGTPNGGLTIYDGTLYGSAFRGKGRSAHGNVFSVPAPGALRILTHFRFYKDGYYPNGSLVFDPDGNAYGTTESGGVGGIGTIFEIAPTGSKTILHVFKRSDPSNNVPDTGVVRDAAGNLYGTLTNGGKNFCGLIYKLAPDGTYTVLYDFPPSTSAGGEPFPSALSIDAQGNLYGTTLNGGAYGVGSVFKLVP